MVRRSFEMRFASFLARAGPAPSWSLSWAPVKN